MDLKVGKLDSKMDGMQEQFGDMSKKLGRLQAGKSLPFYQPLYIIP